MNFNKFTIMEFKPITMVIDATIVMIAKRGSGKSFAVRDLVYNYRNLPGGVVIAPTDKMNPFYRYFFPDLFIHYEINPTLLKKILARQTLLIEESKAKKKMRKRLDPSTLLVMDDCLAAAKQWAKDPSIREILMNGRHYKITYILTMQTPLGIGPELRLNFDYIFLLKEDVTVNRKKLYENYAGIFPNLAIFCKVFDKCTNDHVCMVVDNRTPLSDITKKIFWYKASERKFTFGSKKFKNMHKKYYDPDYMKKQMLAGLDIGSMLPRRKNDIDIGVILR